MCDSGSAGLVWPCVGLIDNASVFIIGLYSTVDPIWFAPEVNPCADFSRDVGRSADGRQRWLSQESSIDSDETVADTKAAPKATASGRARFLQPLYDHPSHLFRLIMLDEMTRIGEGLT